MKRFFTSLALLVASFVPAQAGLLDWGNGQPTTLSGLGAKFTTSGTDGIANLSAGDLITGIFDFGTINGRDVFGLLRAQVGANGTSLVRPSPGSDALDFILGSSGQDFEAQYAALTEQEGFADPIFALFSSSSSQDLASVANSSAPLLGITPGSFELDMLAGVYDGSDLLSFASSSFVMGLTVTDTNGSVVGFADISYGTASKSSELVTTGAASITDVSGWAFEITSGPNLQFTAVPEPSSLAILGLVGVAGSAMRRRRQK
jgi:hypothetical protein